MNIHCYFIIATLAIIISSCHAVLSGIGTLQECTETSSANTTSTLLCAQKYVITMAVQNGAIQGTESLTFGDLNKGISDPDNHELGYQFSRRTEITVSKSTLQLRFPLVYMRTMNNKPYEISKQTNGNGPFNWLLNPCRDGWNDNSASCGFYYDPPYSRNASHRVWDSQGFCCKCGLDDYLGTSGDYARSNMECSFFSIFGSSADHSAHCLRFDNLWYMLFDIGSPDIVYTLIVNITSCDLPEIPWEGSNSTAVNETTSSNATAASAIRLDPANANATTLPSPTFTPVPTLTCVSESLELGPANPIGLSSDAKLQVQLLGDYAAWEGTLDLSGKYFFWPDTCDVFTPECVARISKNPSSPEIKRWMLVDKHLVTMDGSECNKIGVSHSAFRSQSDPCEQKMHSCLENQIEHFYQKDLDKENKGLKGSYFISNYGDISMLDMYSEQPKLYYDSHRYQNSEILFEFSADRVFHTTTLSEAIITNATIFPFEAYSRNGLLHVEVSNVGYRNSQYIVNVLCGPNIAPIAARPVAVAARKLKEVNFTVQAETTLGGHHSCNMTLLDAIGRDISTYSVNVTLLSVDDDRGPQGGEASGPTDGDSLSNDGAALLTCAVACHSFFGLMCFVRMRCWKQILYLALLLIGVLLILFLMIKFGIPAIKKHVAKRKKEREMNELRKEIELENERDLHQSPADANANAGGGRGIAGSNAMPRSGSEVYPHPPSICRYGGSDDRYGGGGDPNEPSAPPLSTSGGHRSRQAKHEEGQVGAAELV